MDNVSNEIKRELVQSEMSRYENTIYLWTIRVRIAKRLEDKALEENAMKELERCEKALDVLKEELQKITSN